MEKRSEVQSVLAPVTSNVQSRLSIWQRLKSFGLKKLFLICVGIGAGLGIGVVAAIASVVWLTSRPIPARDWPRLEVEGAGLKAKLKTDWNDSLRYQLVVTPRSDDLKVAFDDAVRSRRDSISFTVLLFDKAGFELCKKIVKPTPIVGAGNRVDGLQANDTFDRFECSRSNYKEADHWNLGYRFPSLITVVPAGGTVAQQESNVKAKAVGTPGPSTHQEMAPTEEDDTLTGFDYYEGHLETLSGKTFLVREGEKSIASDWIIHVQVYDGRQPPLHISCKTKGECVIENTTNHQMVHGKRIR